MATNEKELGGKFNTAGRRVQGLRWVFIEVWKVLQWLFGVFGSGG